MVNFLDLEKFKSFFDNYVANASTYGEFGCGASTLFVLQNAPQPQKVYSVENDCAWVDNILNNVDVQNAKRTERLHVLCIETGQVGAWGYPQNTEKRENWPNYSSALNGFELDVCIIDGRFRVACALNVLLHQSPNCVIIFDDFWNRPHYHIVLQYCDVLDRCERIAILRKKERFDTDQALKDLQHFQYVTN